MQAEIIATVLNPDEVQNTIDAFIHLPADSELQALRSGATQALTLLSRQCQILKAAANGYPANSINGKVWFDGVALAALARKLANELQARHLIDLEEKARAFHCVAVLAVQSHYHHIVGPAMLARADCNERLGNPELAAQIYEAVIADFCWLVEEWEESPEIPITEDQLSLRCLDGAIERLLALQPTVNTTTLLPLQTRCRQILSRLPAQMPPINNDLLRADLNQARAAINPLLDDFATHLRQRTDVKQVTIVPFNPSSDDASMQPLRCSLFAERQDGRLVEWWFTVQRQTTQWVLEYGVDNQEAADQQKQTVIWFADKQAMSGTELSQSLQTAHADIRRTEDQELVLGYKRERVLSPNLYGYVEKYPQAQQRLSWRDVVWWIVAISALLRLLLAITK